LITTTTKQMSEWAVDAGLVVERLRLAQQDMEFHLGRCAMPREIFAEYKGRQIAVTVIPRVDGQFRIERHDTHGSVANDRADLACDLVGFPAVIPEGIEMLRSGGTYLEIGTISRGAKVELEPALLVWGSKKIVGVIQYDPWVIPRALDFLVRTRERYPWNRILSHKYPLERINEAFAASEWHNRETTTITRAALTP